MATGKLKPGVWQPMGGGLFFGKDANGDMNFLYGQGDGKGIIVKDTGGDFELVKGSHDPFPANGGLSGSNSNKYVRWMRDGGAVEASSSVRGGGKAVRGRGKGKIV